MQWTDAEGVSWSLHEACYAGRLDAVTALLDAGADPNGSASGDDHWRWYSAAGPRPRPLHCAAIAWEYKPEHAAIVKLLRERGAVVEDTVLTDYWIETTLTDEAIAVGAALGEDESNLRAEQQASGAVFDRYADGKVLFVRDTDDNAQGEPE